MNVSPRALSNYINQQKGVNFNRWINELKIAEAKRLLMEKPNEKLGYIAVCCGFPDMATLNRAFHKVEGCSPNVYKLKQTQINYFPGS